MAIPRDGSFVSEVQTMASFVLVNTWAIGMLAMQKAASYMPNSINNALSSTLDTAQSAIIERPEARIALLLLLLPITATVAIGSAITVALTWPLSFVLSLIGILAAVPWYLFHPDRSSIRTVLFSAIFAIGSQLVLAVPAYFLAPFAFAGGMLALAAYLTFASHRYLYVPICLWWGLTAPYWFIFHFVGFPILFVASIGVQLAAVLAGMTALYFYPQFPRQLQSQYSYYTQHVSSKRRDTFNSTKEFEKSGHHESASDKHTASAYAHTHFKQEQKDSTA